MVEMFQFTHVSPKIVLDIYFGQFNKYQLAPVLYRNETNVKKFH
jgi:hypothetical protein